MCIQMSFAVCTKRQAKHLSLVVVKFINLMEGFTLACLAFHSFGPAIGLAIYRDQDEAGIGQCCFAQAICR